MKNKVLFISLFLGCYLVFLLATLPAQLAMQFVSLPKHIALGQVKGSLWQSEISTIQYQDVAINNVSIDLSPITLLFLSPSADISFGGNLVSGPKGQLSVTYSFGEISVQDANIEMPANDVAPYLMLPIDIEAFGNLALNLDELVIDAMQCQQAKGVLNWRRAAATAMEQTIELGDFTANVKCHPQGQDKAFALDINPNNNLGLSYLASVTGKGQLAGEGYLQPGDNFPESLKQALPFIGNPDSQGRYQLKF